MALFYDYTSETVDLKIWKIEESFAFFEKTVLLSNSEKDALYLLKGSRRKLEFIVTRYLLQLCKCIETQLQYESSGKPKPINGKSISISHCVDYVAVLISSEGSAGLDIEVISERAGRIAKRFLSDSEHRFVIGNNELTTLFWSAKEAMFKMCVVQGVDFKTNFSIEPKLDNKTLLLRSTIVKEGKTVNVALHYKIFEKIVLVWGLNYDDI